MSSIKAVHTDRMKEHLIAQFADKPVLYAELEALGQELDLLHKAFCDLRDKRWIDTGEGVQLDNIGTIINRSRQISNAIQIDFFGFQDQDNTQTFGVGRFREDGETWLKSTILNDERYRKILWLKVFKDVSNGYADDILHAVSVLFDVGHVSLQEIGNAKLLIGIGKELSANDIRFLQAVDLLPRGAGIGIYAADMYDYDNYLGFVDQPNAKGFDAGTFADLITIGG